MSNSNLIKTYIMTVEQNEDRFQIAYNNWSIAKENKNPKETKKAYDTIWLSVQFACENIAKSIYTKRNIIVPQEDLDDITSDSTCYVMKFINKGIRPTKLSSYCYLRVRKFIDEPKKIWYDKHIVQMPNDNYKNTPMEIEDE